MKVAATAFVGVVSLCTGCVVSNAPPPQHVPPGQVRSEQVHERNAERKAERQEEKREKKEEKEEKKGP